MDVVRYLCELPSDRGVDPKAQDNNAIRMAASHGHVDVVRYLCELPSDRGVDPSVEDNDAICCAASERHTDVVRYLCELPPDQGVDPSAQNNRAIRLAASNGHVDVVRYLCELPSDRGVDPQACCITVAPWYCTRQLQVVRYLGCLTGMLPRTKSTQVSCAHRLTAMLRQAGWEPGSRHGSMHTRRMARQAVLALCAFVRGPRPRGGRVSPTQVHSSV